MSSFVVQRDGRVAEAEDLAPLAFAGYAHFTAMQVRGDRIRGLDLHLGGKCPLSGHRDPTAARQSCAVAPVEP